MPYYIVINEENKGLIAHMNNGVEPEIETLPTVFILPDDPTEFATIKPLSLFLDSAMVTGKPIITYKS